MCFGLPWLDFRIHLFWGSLALVLADFTLQTKWPSKAPSVPSWVLSMSTQVKFPLVYNSTSVTCTMAPVKKLACDLRSSDLLVLIWMRAWIFVSIIILKGRLMKILNLCFLLSGENSSSELKYYEFLLTEGEDTANKVFVRRRTILLQTITG
jgi:hypothetical protein